MIKKKTQTKNQQKINNIQYTGIVLYALTILVVCLLLAVEPNGLDAKAMIMPVILLLFIVSLGFSYPIATRELKKSVGLIGTIALAVLFAFVGFFVIAATAWFIAVLHI